MNLTRILLISVALLVAPGAVANAADLSKYRPLPPPVPAPVPCPAPCAVPVPVPAPVHVQSGWYLRGFVGMTNQEADSFTNEIIAEGDFTIEQHGFDSSPLVGFGIGVSRGEHFRFDVTGEYRGDSDFRGLDTYVDPNCGPGVCTNEHTGVKNEWLFLANAYWDVANIRGVTPYVGAGVGTARVELQDFWDINQVTNGLWWAQENAKWNFAWAVHAGVAYGVGSDWTVDVGYRYVNLGDGETGRYYTYDPAVIETLGPTKLEDLESHDLMVSLRWNFGHEAVVPAPVYAPPMPMPVPMK